MKQLTIKQLEELRDRQTRYRPYIRVHRRPFVDHAAWILNAALVALIFAAGSLISQERLDATRPTQAGVGVIRAEPNGDLQPITEEELFRP